MSELKKEELLEYFDDMCLFLANHHWTEKDERAVAIREMIQKPEVTEEWIEEKAIEIYNLSYYRSFKVEQIVDCIRSLVEEITK